MCMKREYGNSEKERGAGREARELCWPLRTSTNERERERESVCVLERGRVLNAHTKTRILLERSQEKEAQVFVLRVRSKFGETLNLAPMQWPVAQRGKSFSLCRVRKIRRKSLVLDMLQQLFFVSFIEQ